MAENSAVRDAELSHQLFFVVIRNNSYFHCLSSVNTRIIRIFIYGVLKKTIFLIIRLIIPLNF